MHYHQLLILLKECLLLQPILLPLILLRILINDMRKVPISDSIIEGPEIFLSNRHFKVFLSSFFLIPAV